MYSACMVALAMWWEFKCEYENKPKLIYLEIEVLSNENLWEYQSINTQCG